MYCGLVLSDFPPSPTLSPFLREEWTKAIQTVADGLQKQEEEMMESEPDPMDMEMYLTKPRLKVVRAHRESQAGEREGWRDGGRREGGRREGGMEGGTDVGRGGVIGTTLQHCVTPDPKTQRY